MSKALVEVNEMTIQRHHVNLKYNIITAWCVSLYGSTGQWTKELHECIISLQFSQPFTLQTVHRSSLVPRQRGEPGNEANTGALEVIFAHICALNHTHLLTSFQYCLH